MAASSPPSKATLFCPECPHRSHVTGDWRRVEADRGSRLVCPNCGTIVTTVPDFPIAPRPVSR